MSRLPPPPTTSGSDCSCCHSPPVLPRSSHPQNNKGMLITGSRVGLGPRPHTGSDVGQASSKAVVSPAGGTVASGVGSGCASTRLGGGPHVRSLGGRQHGSVACRFGQGVASAGCPSLRGLALHPRLPFEPHLRRMLHGGRRNPLGLEGRRLRLWQFDGVTSKQNKEARAQMPRSDQEKIRGTSLKRNITRCQRG